MTDITIDDVPRATSESNIKVFGLFIKIQDTDAIQWVNMNYSSRLRVRIETSDAIYVTLRNCLSFEIKRLRKEDKTLIDIYEEGIKAGKTLSLHRKVWCV